MSHGWLLLKGTCALYINMVKIAATETSQGPWYIYCLIRQTLQYIRCHNYLKVWGFWCGASLSQGISIIIHTIEYI